MVDTNVAVVANGRQTHADLQCQVICVEKLRSVVADEVVTIDDEGAILQEYKSRLNFSGMPGVGDMFFKPRFQLPVSRRSSTDELPLRLRRTIGEASKSCPKIGWTGLTGSSWRLHSSQVLSS